MGKSYLSAVWSWASGYWTTRKMITTGFVCGGSKPTVLQANELMQRLTWMSWVEGNSYVQMTWAVWTTVCSNRSPTQTTHLSIVCFQTLHNLFPVCHVWAFSACNVYTPQVMLLFITLDTWLQNIWMLAGILFCFLSRDRYTRSAPVETGITQWEINSGYFSSTEFLILSSTVVDDSDDFSRLIFIILIKH